MLPAVHPSNYIADSHARAPPQANLGVDALLELSNSVRESLAKHGDFGPDADRMSFFLELALLEEEEGHPTLDFETIKAAHLDKLVAALTECGEMAGSLLDRSVHDVVTAETLEHLWHARFKLDYFMIDEIRARDLAVRWRLTERPVRPRSTTLPTSTVVPGSARVGNGDVAGSFQSSGYVRTFQTLYMNPSDNMCNRWWLDMTCARLDGVVGTERETTSQGDDGVPTLTLLIGREVNTGHNRVRYTREGTLAGMHPALIPQTGKHVRVLRGHLLHSHFAPAAGIRNDGLYVLLTYRPMLWPLIEALSPGGECLDTARRSTKPQGAAIWRWTLRKPLAVSRCQSS
jgi:hypothetical protein